MYEEENNDLLNTIGVSGLAGGGLTSAVIAERARRKAAKEGMSYGDAFVSGSKDLADDIYNAMQVVIGETDYDKIVSADKDNPGGTGNIPGSLRKYAESLDSTDSLYAPKKPTNTYNRNPITQAAVAMRDAFRPSAEDFLGFHRENRLERGESPEGPKSDTVLGRVPSFDAVRDVLPERFGGFDETQRDVRKKQGIDLMRGNSAQTTGAFIGRTASDFVNNGARSLWWLLNAPQAVVDVGSEAFTGLANREGLYGLDYADKEEAMRKGWIDKNGDPLDSAVNPVRYDRQRPSNNDPQLTRRLKDLMKNGSIPEHVYSKRRVGNNLSTLLALPGAYLINEGLGLTNLFGGDDGRKAVFPDEMDPTQTSNAVAEVAAKYILGRQGDLLPWDEYKKVRPDVTKDEYMAYKGYRFNKKEDWNIFDDGKVNMLNGVIKANDDGIDGSEIMFLGRSMPIATTIVPTLAAVGGASLGGALSKYGALNIDGLEEGIGRRNTQIEQLKKKARTASASPEEDVRKTAPELIKRADALAKQVENKENFKRGLETGPMKGFFTNPTIRNQRVITGGLLGGAVAGGLTAAVSNMIEQRRRNEEAELGI